jgi:chromosome segregation ATPase
MSIEASVLLELLADAARADSAETALDLAENEIQHKRGEIYDLEAAIDILKGDVEELEAEAKILCGVVEFPEEASGGL